METKRLSSGFGAGLFPFSEMLQHYGHTGRTGAFLVKHEEAQGKIYLMTGIVAHAETNEIEGEIGALDILSWPSPAYEWIESETPAQMTMSGIVQDLLLRSIQVQTSGEFAKLREQALSSHKESSDQDSGANYLMFLDISSNEVRPFRYDIKTAQVRVGRHADNDIVITDTSVSRKHAILIMNNDAILVRDLGSMNGISINGQPVTQGLAHNGDLLQIGEVKMKVTIEDSAAA